MDANEALAERVRGESIRNQLVGRLGWMSNPKFPSTLTAPLLPPSKSPEASRLPVANSYAVLKIAFGG